MIKHQKSKYTALFIAVVILTLFTISCVSATDNDSAQDQQTLTSAPSPLVTATNDRYVNVNTGNDSWDGTSANHTSGTVGPKKHIVNGISSSTSGGNLYIANGTYYERLTVDRSLNIFGSSRNSTIIDGQLSGIVFKILPNIQVTIQHLTIRNGLGSGTVSGEDGDNGGGVYNQGTLTLTDCNIYNNKAPNGEDGTAGHGAGKGGNGAGVYNLGILTIRSCDIHNNTAGNGGDASATRHGDHGGNGAGIYNTGTLTIQDSQIHDNTAGNGGSHSGVYSGSYGGYGGGIYNTNILNITNCEIYNNKAGNGASNVYGANAQHGGYGGGIYNSGNATMQFVNIHNNTAGAGGKQANNEGLGGEGGYGGAIYNIGNLNINGTSDNMSQITYNNAGPGGNCEADRAGGAGGKAGGIYNAGTCKMTYTNISNNNAGAGGDPNTLNTDGGAGGSAGAICNTATLTLESCTINNNHAGNGKSGITNHNQVNYGGGEGGNGGNAGAIDNAGTLTINNCDISSNKAGTAGNGGQATFMYDGRIGGDGGDGGAIYNTGNITISGSNITQNFAGNGGNGGLGRAIKHDNNGGVVYGNPGNGGAGGNGGAICNLGIIKSITNTIIQNNTAGNGGNGGRYEQDDFFSDEANIIPAIPGSGGSGGGIYNAGTLTNLESTKITSNKAGNGGNGSVCSTIPSENGATGGSGGGIFIIGPSIITNCEISNNQAGNGGAGGNMNPGSGYLLSEDTGNGGAAGSGGGICINAILPFTVTIHKSTIINNTAGTGGAGGKNDATFNGDGISAAGGNGGGIALTHTNINLINLVIDESTIANNNAGKGGQANLSIGADGTGGGLYTNNNQKINVSFCRIVDNTPQSVYLNLANVDLTNILFKNNWWGSNAEPKDQLIGKNISSSYYTPWILLKINSNSTSIFNSKTSTITASLIMNSNGDNTSTSGKYVPDGIPVTFNANSGIVDPSSSFTTNGASSTIFTANTSGIATVAATIDHQTNSTQIQVIPFADIALTKDVPSPIIEGKEFTITATANNKGPDIATNVVFSNTIPQEFKFVSAIADKGTWNYNQTTRLFTWNIGNLEVGSAHLYLTLKALEQGTYSLTSNLASSTYNPNPENQKSTVILHVNAPKGTNEEGNESQVQAATTTIEMQKTGLPIAGLILAILVLFGGLASSKRK